MGNLLLDVDKPREAVSSHQTTMHNVVDRWMEQFLLLQEEIEAKSVEKVVATKRVQLVGVSIQT